MLRQLAGPDPGSGAFLTLDPGSGNGRYTVNLSHREERRRERYSKDVFPKVERGGGGRTQRNGNKWKFSLFFSTSPTIEYLTADCNCPGVSTGRGGGGINEWASCIALENICGGNPYCPILMYSIQHYNIMATFHTHDSVMYSNSPPLPPSSLLPSGLPPPPGPPPTETLPDLIAR